MWHLFFHSSFPTWPSPRENKGNICAFIPFPSGFCFSVPFFCFSNLNQFFPYRMRNMMVNYMKVRIFPRSTILFIFFSLFWVEVHSGSMKFRVFTTMAPSGKFHDVSSNLAKISMVHYFLWFFWVFVFYFGLILCLVVQQGDKRIFPLTVL